MSFKETCKKVREAIAEDLKKKGPYDVTDEEFKQAWKDVGNFFAKGARKVKAIFGCGKQAKDESNAAIKAANNAKSR